MIPATLAEYDAEAVRRHALTEILQIPRLRVGRLAQLPQDGGVLASQWSSALASAASVVGEMLRRSSDRE